MMRRLVLLLLFATLTVSASDDVVEDSGSGEENLLAKIDCQVGEKHQYVLVTQSSLFAQDGANLQVRALIELKCLRHQKWHNESSGFDRDGQLLEARINSVTPILLEKRVDNAGLQMAALFSSLKAMEEMERNRNQPNIRLGSVNGAFAEMSDKFGRWLKEMFYKVVQFFERILKKQKSGTQDGITFRCEESRRQKRHTSFKSIDFEKLSPQFERMYEHPFSFVQLDDGSIEEIQISEKEVDPNVVLLKRFIAKTFATQLDERKKTVVESSEFGTHLSHYEIDYDEPDRKRMTPEEYMSSMYRRSRRSEPIDSHLVSVIRSVSRADILENRGANQLRAGVVGIGQIDFSAQQVQLIHGNMLVASGGYFQSFFPNKPGTARAKRDTQSQFDLLFQKYLNFDMQYSMVRVGKNGEKRWKRETKFDSIDYLPKLKSIYANILPGGPRDKRSAEKEEDKNENVVCKTFVKKKKSNTVETNEISSEAAESNLYDECYEYKQFGSGLFKAYFNKTVIASHDKSKVGENFVSKYRVGALLLGEDIFLGEVELKKNTDKTKFNINLFGSEYVDLNLCEIKDKNFSHISSVPLISENIWFMTNVGIQVMYKLAIKTDIPSLACEAPKESRMAERILSDQLAIDQITEAEFGATFDASFMMFSGNMKLNSDFKMRSEIDFGDSCLNARSNVKPVNLSLGFIYKFYHPVCKKWMQDSWFPKRLNFKVGREYRNTWFRNACV